VLYQSFNYFYDALTSITTSHWASCESSYLQLTNQRPGTKLDSFAAVVSLALAAEP